MHVSFICVGRLSSEYQAVWQHYERLSRPYFSPRVLEVAEVALAQGDEQVRKREGDTLLALVQPGAFTVALDGRGTQYTSEEWSAFLAAKKLHGSSHFQFILGGAAGLDERVLAASDTRWCLSRLTFPHQMARCIALEQLYRAVRIERGEPYHH
jgi:23S rRNA (pseudouridine1915-N3)-methyltransferase